MKNLHAMLFACALAFGCEGTIAMTGSDGAPLPGAVSSPGGGSSAPGSAAAIADGAALYALYCETCHGPEGTGAPPWPGSIQGFEPIRDIVANGRGAMSAQPLDAAQIEAVQAYLLSFGAADWSSLSGPEVFTAACASCHGEQAEGTERGPQLRFRDAEYFDHVTRHGAPSRGRWASDMDSYAADRISDAQLAEMIAWIDSFPNATDGEGLYHQFCANCHGGTGVQGWVEPEFDGSIYSVSRSGKEDSVANPSYMPGWPASEISDGELQQIQAFIDATFPGGDD